MANFVLRLDCLDRPGILHSVAAYLHRAGGNVVDSRQFQDPLTGQFLLRIEVEGKGLEFHRLRDGFVPLAEEYGMNWRFDDRSVRQRILVMVSRYSHCLTDLLARSEAKDLGADVVAVVSNHTNLAGITDFHGVPFHYVPVTPATKPRAEARLLELIAELRVDLVVLARYMQILSNDLCMTLEGRAINIHHSFLPSFKGARPYHQAYARGVKIIGATAHYVSPELDEGPIIEQEVARVDHSRGPAELEAIGRDLERITLARAVHWHVEHRVLLSGPRTVIFP
ncbi:MAG: formyltetrahydrofolate deformylase [Longispora sp.]|nr:formyltetrahydrofolate deformylase [Longispora sp. (in: high G+C Gram-positive bacteria)]